jgi:hypothetical protein
MSVPLMGDVYPGTIDPRIKRKWITDYPYGPPIQPEKTSQPDVQPPGMNMKPKHIGDETHFDMAQLLKKLQVTQKTDQITKALPQYRDWR